MDESLKKQSQGILQGAPTLGFEEKVIEPLDIPEKEYKPELTTTATTKQQGGVVTQSTGTKAEDSALLNETSGTPYMGGSTIPGQEVSARLRAADGSEGNPFYLEPQNRFVTVKPYKITLPALQQEFTVDSIDPQKIAYILATMYQGVPKSNFVGYQYVAPELEETMWDASTWAKISRQVVPSFKKAGAEVIGSIGKGVGNVMSIADAVLKSDEAKQDLAKLGDISIFDLINMSPNAEVGEDIKAIKKKYENNEEFKNLRKAIEDATNLELTVKTVSGLAQKEDSSWGNSLWNESERLIANATKELKETMKDNALVNPTLGAEVVQAVPTSLAAMAPTLALGPWFGPALRTLSYRESILHELMDKGMTYAEAEQEATKGGVISGAIEFATAQAGSMLSKYFLRNYTANTLSRALAAGAVSYATKAPFEVVGETYQEKVENYFAQNVGLETFTQFDRQDIIVALSSLIAEMPDVATSARHEYIKSREKLKTKEEREKYDAAVMNRFKELVEHGRAFREVFIKLGFTEEQADIIVMQAQANGKEQFEHYLQDTMAGHLDRLMNGELQETINGAAQTLAPASKDPMVFAREEYEKLDQRLNDLLLGIHAEDITESDKNAIKALYKLAATEWAYRTGNNISEFSLPFFFSKRLNGNTAQSFIQFDKRTGERVTQEIHLSDQISQKIGVAPSDEFSNFSSLTPVFLTTKSALVHEVVHDILDTFVRDSNIDPVAFREFIDMINEFGLKKAYDKKSESKGSADKLRSESAIDYAGRNQDKIRENIKTGYQPPYNHPANFTEYAAQATGFLGKDSAKMLGMGTSKSWAFLSKLNRILAAMNDVTPLSTGIQNWLKEFESFIKQNSDALAKLAEAKGLNNLKTALAAIKDGNMDAINWKDISWDDLKQLTDLINKPLNAQGMAIAQEILDGYSQDDIANVTEKMWESAWAIDKDNNIVENNPVQNVESADTETDLDEVELDDLLDPFEGVINRLKQDTEPTEETTTVENEYLLNTFLNALADKEQEAKQPKSAFDKQLEKKVGGRTLEEDLDQMIDLVKNTKRKRGISAWLSERRGIVGPLFSLGGLKALKLFDFAGKQQAFRDMYNGRMSDFRKKVIKEMFGGDSLAYSNFITGFMARNITTKIMDPVTHQEKEIKVSKNIIAQAMLSHAQDKSNGGVRTRATFLDYDNLIKNMSEEDIKFMNMLRGNLKEISTKSFKKDKGDRVGRILENYFPMVSWKAVSEDSPMSTLSFFSRKDTTSPIGVIGAIEVFGRYHGRLAGADSEYFHTVKRMGELLDYPKYAAKDGLVESTAQRLALKSRELRELVVNQIGTSGLKNIEAFLDYVKSGSATRDTSNGVFGKIARTISPALLGGKLKNFFTNVTQAGYWLGAPVKDAPTYWAELAGVLSGNVKKTYEEFMEIGKSRTGTGFFKQRKENAALTEFVSKSTGPGEESLIKDFAVFLRSKNLTKLADLASAASWFAGKITNAVMAPNIAGDVVGNMFGAVAYRRALIKENLNKGMSSEDAILDADNKVIDFVLTRESSTNQAVKPKEILDWNRNNAIFASLGQFTGETTASWGAVGQAYQGYQMGEIDKKTAIKEIVSILSGHLAYRAVQAGLFGAAFSAAIGDLDDEEKEFVLKNIGDQMAQEIIEGIAGPYSAIANSVVLSRLNDRSYGISIPVISETNELMASLEKLTMGALTEEEIKTSDLVRAIGSSASMVGAFPALENILNSVRGVYLSVYGETEAERKKGRYMATGRTEGFAEKAAGIKRTGKKKVDYNSVIK